MEFWNDMATDKSWDVLIRLKKMADFVLIGGWACYLLAKALKSKDIDIIVDYETLDKLKNEFRLKKTHFLRKYEIRIEGISIDIYVPFYSRLGVPVEEIKKHCTVVEGFRVPVPAMLLILKQTAEMERKDSVKGQKDRADILNLLINAEPDMQKYSSLAKESGLREYPGRLKTIVSTAKKEFEYLGIRNPRRIRLLKRAILQRMHGH